MDKLAEIFFHIQKKPGLYFRHPRCLRDVQTFLTGFELGRAYSGAALSFGHFTRWVASTYRVRDGAMGGFCLIFEHVGEDEQRAFEEFFRLLPDYIRDLQEIGPDGIHKRYLKVMGEIRGKR